jgi:hypothetical protein
VLVSTTHAAAVAGRIMVQLTPAEAEVAGGLAAGFPGTADDLVATARRLAQKPPAN